MGIIPDLYQRSLSLSDKPELTIARQRSIVKINGNFNVLNDVEYNICNKYQNDHYEENVGVSKLGHKDYFISNNYGISKVDTKKPVSKANWV